jgi:hypothetical protein
VRALRVRDRQCEWDRFLGGVDRDDDEIVPRAHRKRKLPVRHVQLLIVARPLGW